MAELKFLNSVGATVMINGVEQDSVTVSCGATVIWEVSKEGYATQSGSQEVWEDTVKDITLELERYEITFVVSPGDAALTVNGELMELDVGRCSVTVKWGDTVTWSCAADGHVGQVRSFTAKCGETLYITLDMAEEESRSVRFVVSPADAVLTVNGEAPEPDVDGRYTVVAHDGDMIRWSCVCGGYVSKSGSFIVDGNSTTYVTLVAEPEPEYATITITPVPSDATVVINGEERTEYTAEVGTEIEWSVSKEGYMTQSGSLTIDGNRTIEVTLVYEDAVFSDVEITEFSYVDIPASGGAATPTLKYRQTWGYGSDTGGGVIEDGAEVSYEGVGTDGSHTEGSLGTTVMERTQVATASVTVTLNGRTATASAEVWQAENKVERYGNLYWIDWDGEKDFTYGSNANVTSLMDYVPARQSAYYSSGEHVSDNVDTQTISFADVEACGWASVSGSELTLKQNMSEERRGPYDIVETCDSEGETISRTWHVYQEGVENPDRTITFDVSPTSASLNVNGLTAVLTNGKLRMTAKDGDVIEWSCKCAGYVSQSGSHTVGGDAVIAIKLDIVYIMVEPASMTLEMSDTGTFTVFSNGEWSVGAIPSGITLSRNDAFYGDFLSEGDVMTGDVEIAIRPLVVLGDTGGTSGSVTFTLTDGSVSATLSYEILATHYIRVGSPDVFGADGGETTVSVRSTSAWRLDAKSDWLAVAPDSGDEGSTAVVVTAEALPDGTDSRSGTAKFTNDDGDSATMTATQERETERSLRLTPSSAVIDGEAFTMEVTGSGAVSAYIDGYAPMSGESVTMTVGTERYVIYGNDSPVQIPVVDGVTYTCSLEHEIGSFSSLIYPYLLILVFGGVTYTLTVSK